MSGHSKWANIKHKKSIADSKRATDFTKLSRLITIASRQGGPDKEANVGLRLAVDRARASNMPKDTIERAIAAGAGDKSANMTEIIYEAFDASGKGLLIVTSTDNSNRTFSEVRHIVERGNGKMGTRGAVAYLFQKCGQVRISKSQISIEELLTISESLSVIDIIELEEEFEVSIPFENLGLATELFKKYDTVNIHIIYKSLQPGSELSAAAPENQNLVNHLMDHLDVHDVFVQ